MDNKIVVYGLDQRPQLKLKIKKITRTVLRYLHIHSRTLDIIFLNNKKMVALKRRYLGKPGPANTLSFESGQAFPGPQETQSSLGEIYVNTSLTHYRLAEIAPLLIHSTLHLLGYHHGTERDKIEMDRLAFKISKISKA